MGRDRKRRGIAAVGPWLPLPLGFLRSRAAAELSPHATKLLLDALAQLGPNATRNGDLSFAPAEMRKRGWTSRSTLAAAVSELTDFGILACTRKGSRLSCSLYAITLFPLDCDLAKIDVRPGSYSCSAWATAGGDPPTEASPAVWRRARKTELLAPPRDEAAQNRPATGRTAARRRAK